MTEYDVDAGVESHSPSAPPGEETDVSPCYQARVERTERGRAVCTIYSEFNANAVADTWVRAVGDAFVSREECR